MRKFLNFSKALPAKLLIILKTLFLSIFGDIRWNKPNWLNRLDNWFKAKIKPAIEANSIKIKTWSQVQKKMIRKVSLGMLVLMGLGIYAYQWWESQPKPVKVSFTITAPDRTRVEENLKPDTLKIRFASSVAPLEEVGKVTKKVVSLHPEVEGNWKWDSDSLLVFTPKTDWPIAQKYQVDLDPEYFPKHLVLEKYKGEFETAKFSVLSKSAEFYQHPENPKDKRVTAKIILSHPVSPESVKGKVKIKLSGNQEVLGGIPMDYNAEISFNKLFDELYITSELIPLPLKDTTATITLQKGFGATRGGNKYDENLEFQVPVPGRMTFFRIANASFQFVENQKYDLEQVVIIESSTEVLETEFDKSLEMYLLPFEKLPPESGKKSKHAYRWGSGEVTAEVLKKSSRIHGIRVPGERAHSSLHTFKISVPQNRSIFIRVNKGLKSFHEYLLAEDFQQAVQVQNFPEEIRILHEGAILAISGEKKLSILSRGIKSYQVEVGHVLANQLNHLLSQAGGDIGNPQFYSSYQFNWDNISEKFTEVIDIAAGKSGKTEFSAFDVGKYLNKAHGGGRGLLYLSLRPYNRESKTSYGQAESRFVLVSDLGVIEKKMADNSHEIFIQSLFAGTPVGGATVEVIGKNGLPVATATTDAQGRVRLNNLNHFKNEKYPLAFVVQKGTDLSFLPLNRYERKLQYSRFDIGGVRTQGTPDKLQAYVFTDRGLYRPGETFHLSGIVRSFDWKTDLTDVPIEWVVTDAKNQEIFKEKVTLTKNGFIELSNQTQETAFVGTYTGSLFLVNDHGRAGLLGSTTFRVEEFVPDRMKISAGFSVVETSGWTSPEGLKTWVRLMTLFGYPAENRKVTGKIWLAPASPYFPKFPNHRFYFPKTEKSFEENLSEIQTNEKGEVEYPIDLSKYEKGNYRVRFQAEAFELEGGRSVLAEATMMVSPYKYFIGYTSDADLNYLKLGSKHTIDYLAVSPNLTKAEVKDLSMTLIEKQWVSVLTKQPNGTFKYESVMRDREVKKTRFTINNKGTKYEIPTSDPGDYKLVITNGEGIEVSYLEFSVVGQKNILGKLDKTAELQIKLSKGDYSVDEEIEMQIRAPYVGSGMITIERDKVYAVKWFKTTSTNSLQKIKVPAGLEGNAYINVTFLRDIGSKEIFMSPLSYGVVPFSVDLKKRQIKLDVKVANEVRPGMPLKIEFSGNRKGKIIVFAVDEGILQVAKYQTPDPLKTFFQKRALEIETSQLLDLLLPEFKLIKELSASGGDADSGLSKNLNPFRRKGKPPVAFWSGIIDIDETMKSVTYNVPDYFNGTLRVMAVAVSPDSIGVARKDTIVRGDFIITPSVPFVLTPGDEAVVGVSVFNNAKGSGLKAKIHLDIKASEHLEVLDGTGRDLEISETKEVSTTVRVRAKETLGVAKVDFIASYKDKSAKLSEDLSLRPATPYRTQVWGGYVKDGKTSVELQRKTYPEFARRTVAVSFLPLVLAHGLSEYLTDFPYGCTEQLLSKAFPTLLLGDKVDFGFTPAQREKAFKNTLALLRQRQTSDGGFGLYWSYGESAEFPSIYAIHYLIEAKDRGFGVPQDLQDRVQAYLRGLVNRTPSSMFMARSTAYALYLLARFGQSVGNEITTLAKEIASSNFNKDWSGDLGAMYMAATYQLMHQDALAERLVKPLSPQKNYFSLFEEYHDLYIHNSMMVYLLARHFPEKLKGYSAPAVESFVAMLQNNHYSTLNSSMVILALEALSKAGGETVESVASVVELDEAGKETSLVLGKSLFPKVKFSQNAKSLSIQSTTNLGVYYQAHQSAFDLVSSVKANNSKIEIVREYRKPGTKEVLNKLAVGDELEVYIMIRSLDKKTYNNIAVVDMLPSGFEVVLERRPKGALNEIQNILQPKLLPPPAEKWSLFLSPLIEKAYAQEDGASEGEVSEEGEVNPGYSEEVSGEEAEGGPQAASAAPEDTAAEIPTLAQPGSTLNVQFEDPREDRIVLYATAEEAMREYIYRIKATNLGKFKVPPAFAEDMYDKTVQSLGPVGSIEVEDRK